MKWRVPKLPDRSRRVLQTVGSAVLLALAFPPFDVRLLVFVALVPFFGVLREVGGRGAYGHGYLFGALFFGSQLTFLYPLITAWTGSAFLGATPTLVAAFLAGFVFGLAGWLVHRCWHLGLAWLIPFAWVSVEGLRAYLPELAYPWGFLGFPLWPYPWAVQHAAVGTVLFVSAWVAVPNVILVQVLWPEERGPSRKVMLRMGVGFVGVLVLSAMRYFSPPATEPRVLAVAQPVANRSTLPGGDPESAARAYAIGPSLVSQAAGFGADLIIFPEAFAQGGETLPPESPVGESPVVPVLMGGYRMEGETVYQSAYAYDGEWQVADKTRLVVFGEYVPFRQFLPFLAAFRLPTGDLTPGKELKVLEVAGMRAGGLICFEALFPDLAERQQALGAQFIAVMAIDDWYEGTPAPAQLAGSAVWRSIESGLPMMRSTSRGISLATDARGNVIALAPLVETLALRVEVGLPRGGDGFPFRTGFLWLCGAVGLGLLGQAALGSRRAKAEEAEKTG